MLPDLVSSAPYRTSGTRVLESDIIQAADHMLASYKIPDIRKELLRADVNSV